MAIKKYKRKIYSGCVLDVEVYAVNEGVKDANDIERKLKRPRTEEESSSDRILRMIKGARRAVPWSASMNEVK